MERAGVRYVDLLFWQYFGWCEIYRPVFRQIWFNINFVRIVLWSLKQFWIKGLFWISWNSQTLIIDEIFPVIFLQFVIRSLYRERIVQESSPSSSNNPITCLFTDHYVDPVYMILDCIYMTDWCCHGEAHCVFFLNHTLSSLHSVRVHDPRNHHRQLHRPGTGAAPARQWQDAHVGTPGECHGGCMPRSYTRQAHVFTITKAGPVQ